MANTPLRSLSKPTAQVLLHLGGGAGAIHDNHQLFTAKQLQDGLRFGVIILQARVYGFGRIVGAGDQLAPQTSQVLATAGRWKIKL